MDIEQAYHPELVKLGKDIHPEKAMDTMDKHKEEGRQ